MKRSLVLTVLLSLLFVDVSLTAVASENVSVEFKLVCQQEKKGCQEISEENPQESLFVEKKPALAIDDIASATMGTANFDDSKIQISLNLVLTPEGQEKLKNLTEQNIGRRLALFIDNKLINAAEIKEPIFTTEITVVSGMSQAEAEDIVRRINER